MKSLDICLSSFTKMKNRTLLSENKCREKATSHWLFRSWHLTERLLVLPPYISYIKRGSMPFKLINFLKSAFVRAVNTLRMLTILSKNNLLCFRMFIPEPRVTSSAINALRCEHVGNFIINAKFTTQRRNHPVNNSCIR